MARFKREAQLAKILKELYPYAKVKRQFPYKDLDKSVAKLHADFAFIHWQVLVELQGEQHFRPIQFGKGFDAESKFQRQRRIDALKRKIAKNAGWTLVEIPPGVEIKKRSIKKLVHP